MIPPPRRKCLHIRCFYDFHRNAWVCSCGGTYETDADRKLNTGVYYVDSTLESL